MAKLTKAARAAIPTGEFALPGRRFPLPDKAHAHAALMSTKNLSASEKATVDAKAKAVLRGDATNQGGPTTRSSTKANVQSALSRPEMNHSSNDGGPTRNTEHAKAVRAMMKKNPGY